MVGKNEIENLLSDSQYEVIVKKGSGWELFGPESKKLQIERIVSKEGDNLIFKLRVRNVSKTSFNINSFVISDLFLPKNLIPRKVLEHGWLQCSEVAYKKLNQPTEKNQIFLRRDQNPFSFKEEFGYIPESIISEWFTILDFGADTLLIGAVTIADQFSQIYIKKLDAGVEVKVTSQFDGLMLEPGQVTMSESIIFSFGGKEKVETDFAKSLAKHMGIKKVLPPIKAMCCSYYWHGNKITEESINGELDALENLPEKLNLDYFQLDAGYTRYFGDWLNYEKNFPNGFEDIVNRIRAMGYKPGIWISPFAINSEMKLHSKHKNWFLKGKKSDNHFEGRASSPIDSLVPDLDLEVYDPTNEEFRKYLREVLLHFKSLGFEFFKIDFMYPVCLTNKYSKPVTRAQALRSGVKLIRDTLGDTPILSCISQLSPLVGLVDYVRTGIDTLNPFVCGVPILNKAVNDFMLVKDLKEGENRLFLNGIVWRADPDMLVFRKGTGIDEKKLKKQKQMAKKNKMCLWVGDSVSHLDEAEKSNLIRFFNDA